jgi:hypothetical protein
MIVLSLKEGLMDFKEGILVSGNKITPVFHRTVNSISKLYVTNAHDVCDILKDSQVWYNISNTILNGMNRLFRKN